jgi:hypothetical protein
MPPNPLEIAVNRLAVIAQLMSLSDLERPWKWASYDSEGVRFAFFRVQEELRALAVRIAAARLAVGQPPSQAQRILAQYHTAYRELRASLLGLDNAVLDQPPAKEEWPVRRTLAHILGADMGFYVVVRYALDRHRSADDRPPRFGDEIYGRLLGVDEDSYHAIMERPVDGLLDYHAALHQRVLDELSGITDSELELDSYYWEEEPHALRFRLHRFESHLRQHSIQIGKILAALGRLPGEPLHLMHLVYAALAEVEGASLGSDEISGRLAAETNAKIDTWVKEIHPE